MPCKQYCKKQREETLFKSCKASFVSSHVLPSVVCSWKSTHCYESSINLKKFLRSSTASDFIYLQIALLCWIYDEQIFVESLMAVKFYLWFTFGRVHEVFKACFKYQFLRENLKINLKEFKVFVTFLWISFKVSNVTFTLWL